MMTMVIKLCKRQLHTIISREIIKPSSPTPSHLKTYYLSQMDQCSTHSYMPLIFFYPNNKDCSLTPDKKARVIKKSLPHSLTRYYPFAGRLHTPTTPYIDCNDDGVLFVEAKFDSQMDKLQDMISEEDDNTFRQLFADGMVWHNTPHKTSLVGVQLNHFACGGIGVAVSMSHKVGDGCTLGSYVSHWASVARYGSTCHKNVLPLNPHFISTSATNNYLPLETSVLNQRPAKHVTRKFVFPNSKLNDLKNKVLATAEAGSTLSIDNLTRVEVLTSLIYKTAVLTSATFDQPYLLFMPADIRNKFVPKVPETTVGNILSLMMVKTRHISETSLSVVVSEIKKEKMKLDGVASVKHASQNLELLMSQLGNDDRENVANRSFWCSSVCGFPYYKVDFGWGNPTGASIVRGLADKTGSVLMDTPNGDGIKAEVTLEEQDMKSFQIDKELLSFCQI